MICPAWERLALKTDHVSTIKNKFLTLARFFSARELFFFFFFLFDFTKIFLDLNSIIGVFWKFCTINKIFESLANSLSFTRILQDFSSEINKKKNDLRYSFREKDKRQIRSFASTGGLARAEKYREKMTPIFDEVFALFQSRKWKSKSECAKYFIKEFYLKNPDAAIELDSKKLVTEITNRINDRSTSRKVILLADR